MDQIGSRLMRLRRERHGYIPVKLTPQCFEVEHF